MEAGLPHARSGTPGSFCRTQTQSLAGILMASVGAIGCFVANAVSYVPCIGVALWILPPVSAAVHPWTRIGCSLG
jgi:hypothetical protein